MNRIRGAISVAVSDHRTDTGTHEVIFARGHEVGLLRYVHAAGTIHSTATVLSERGAKMKARPLQQVATVLCHPEVKGCTHICDRHHARSVLRITVQKISPRAPSIPGYL